MIICACAPVCIRMSTTVISLLLSSMWAYLHPVDIATCLVLHMHSLCCAVHTVLYYSVGLQLPLLDHLPPATSSTFSFQDGSARLHWVITLSSGGWPLTLLHRAGYVILLGGYSWLFPDTLYIPHSTETLVYDCTHTLVLWAEDLHERNFEATILPTWHYTQMQIRMRHIRIWFVLCTYCHKLCTICLVHDKRLWKHHLRGSNHTQRPGLRRQWCKTC